MGWLNNLLDVASLGVELSQLGKLEELRKQGAAGAMVQAVLQQLRNQIFNYKQAAQTILDAENKETKVAAGAMRVLEMRLEESGISPDLFPDLNDKEYVAATYKFIRDNSARMRGQLAPENLNELDSMASAAYHLPGYSYYVSNYTDYANYKQAMLTKEKLGYLSGPLSGCLLFFAAMFVIAVFFTIFQNMTGLFVGAVVAAAGIIWGGRYFRQSREAKKTVKDLDEKLDIELYTKLDADFRGDLRRATILQNEAETRIKNFFGDSTLLPF